jgi:FkbM family methyltransferase
MIWNEEAQLWIPDDSVKSDRCWRFINRNVQDLDAGIAWTKKKGIAVQAGGHIGIFPNYLAGHFAEVYTFEPDENLFACLLKNRRPRVVPFPYALTSFNGKACFSPSIAGVGALGPEGQAIVQTMTIDYLAERVNFIHLDVEGAEVDVLRGAHETICRHSPTLQLEILPRFKDQVYSYIESIGYRMVNDTRRDHVFVRDEKLHPHLRIVK